MNNQNDATPETEPLYAAPPAEGSGNRWEHAAPGPADQPAPADPPTAVYPPPETGAYPVVAAPVAKRRRARSAAAVAAAAVVAGIGGFAVGHATAGDDAVPASNTQNGTGEGGQDGQRGQFGDRQFGDGQRPEFPGNGQPPGGFPGGSQDQGQDQGQDSGQGSATS